MTEQRKKKKSSGFSWMEIEYDEAEALQSFFPPNYKQREVCASIIKEEIELYKREDLERLNCVTREVDFTVDRYGEECLSEAVNDIMDTYAEEMFPDLMEKYLPEIKEKEFRFSSYGDTRDCCLEWGNQLSYVLEADGDEEKFIEKVKNLFFPPSAASLVEYDLRESGDSIRMAVILILVFNGVEASDLDFVPTPVVLRTIFHTATPYFSGVPGAPVFLPGKVAMPEGYGQMSLTENNVEFLCCLVHSGYSYLLDVFQGVFELDFLLLDVPWTPPSENHAFLMIALGGVSYPFNVQARRAGIHGLCPHTDPLFLNRTSAWPGNQEAYTDEVNLFLFPTTLLTSCIELVQGDRVCWKVFLAMRDGKREVGVSFENAPFPSFSYLIRSSLRFSWSILDPGLSEQFILEDSYCYPVKVKGERLSRDYVSIVEFLRFRDSRPCPAWPLSKNDITNYDDEEMLEEALEEIRENERRASVFFFPLSYYGGVISFWKTVERYAIKRTDMIPFFAFLEEVIRDYMSKGTDPYHAIFGVSCFLDLLSRNQFVRVVKSKNGLFIEFCLGSFLFPRPCISVGEERLQLQIYSSPKRKWSKENKIIFRDYATEKATLIPWAITALLTGMVRCWEQLGTVGYGTFLLLYPKQGQHLEKGIQLSVGNLWKETDDLLGIVFSPLYNGVHEEEVEDFPF